MPLEPPVMTAMRLATALLPCFIVDDGQSRPAVGPDQGPSMTLASGCWRHDTGPRSPIGLGGDSMAKSAPEPKRLIREEDIDPRYNWGRALPALGTMGVDFEERVDYRRLHRYRLGRATQVLEKSECGSLAVIDVNNIRYLTSSKLGKGEPAKLCRRA